MFWRGGAMHQELLYVYYFGTECLAVIGIKWTVRGLPTYYNSDTHLWSNYTAILINLPKCYTQISLTSISLYIFSLQPIHNESVNYFWKINTTHLILKKFNFHFSFYVCVIRGGAGAHLGFMCCWRCGAPLLVLLWDKTLYFQASGSTRLWLKMRGGLFFLDAQIIATSWEYHGLAEMIPFSSWSLISCFVSLTFSTGQIKVLCFLSPPRTSSAMGVGVD